MNFRYRDGGRSFKSYKVRFYDWERNKRFTRTAKGFDIHDALKRLGYKNSSFAKRLARGSIVIDGIYSYR